ncbi:MAG: PIN domain-containing protein [Propionibacterium sp.]|nr:PIN domain-containing protein [Propionibacterium sp.]
MRPIVFLDANVLVPYDLTCVLLAMAEQEILDVKWSERVLEEVRGTLVNKLSFPSRRIERRLDAMQTGFPEAMVVGYEGLERGLSCDPKDRHVLAAAIGAEATHLVTANVKDFDAREVATFDMKLLHPDRFLNLDLLAGWFKPPETRIWPDDAQQRILGYLRERATAGVLLAAGFTTATLKPRRLDDHDVEW